MKSALRARLTEPNWVDELPWVLLGIHTAPKDLGCLSAELVYGNPVTVPGDFIALPDRSLEHHSKFQRLRQQVQHLAPVPTSQHRILPPALPRPSN